MSTGEGRARVGHLLGDPSTLLGTARQIERSTRLILRIVFGRIEAEFAS